VLAPLPILSKRARFGRVVVEGLREARRLGRREELLWGLSTAESDTATLGWSVDARGVEIVDIVWMLFFRRGGK